MEELEVRVAFPEVEPCWLESRDAVLFLAMVDGRPVRCLITREALSLLYKSGYRSDECIKSVRENQNDVHFRANEKIAKGDFNLRGEVVIACDDPDIATPPKAVLLFTSVSNEIRKDPELEKLIKKANRVLFTLVANSFITVRADWHMAGKNAKDVVQLSMADKADGTNLLEWFTVDQLKNEEFMRTKLGQMWGDFLQELSHRQLEAIMGNQGD